MKGKKEERLEGREGCREKGLCEFFFNRMCESHPKVSHNKPCTCMIPHLTPLSADEVCGFAFSS